LVGVSAAVAEDERATDEVAAKSERSKSDAYRRVLAPRILLLATFMSTNFELFKPSVFKT
jgi:hypothetical protein